MGMVLVSSILAMVMVADSEEAMAADFEVAVAADWGRRRAFLPLLVSIHLSAARQE